MLLLISFYAVGILFVLISIYLRYWRGKRKFYKRNIAGQEVFSSYNKALTTNWLENSAQFISIFLMIVGIIPLLAAYFGADDLKRVTHW